MMPTLLLALAASAAETVAPCAQLERHGRLLRQSESRPDAWNDVREAFAVHFESLAGNPAARRAALQLRGSSIRLTALAVSDAVGRTAAAIYDPTSRLIAFDSAEFQALWAAWDDVAARREELAILIDRTAPVLVHELMHARIRDDLGAIPPFSEEELVADAEETLYLLWRMKSDPGYLERSADEWIEERWRLVRGMGYGYDAFAETLRGAGVLDGPSVFSLADAQRRLLLAESRALRQAHERCLGGASEEAVRADLAGWVVRLEGEERTYADADRLTAVARRYRAVMEDQRRDLALLASPSHPEMR